VSGTQGARELVMRPRSRFLLVSCIHCGNRQVLPDTAKMRVVCNVCGEALAVPTGGKARIIGRIERVLE